MLDEISEAVAGALNEDGFGATVLVRLKSVQHGSPELLDASG